MKHFVLVIALLCTFAGNAFAQRIAVLEPMVDGSIPHFAETLRAELAKRARIIDKDLAAAAYTSVQVPDPFNMSTDEARRVGIVIGCDRFLIHRSALQRRAAGGGSFYIEAYAVTYLVDARTGTLLGWRITKAEAKNDSEAVGLLLEKVPGLATYISEFKIGPLVDPPKFPEPPPENSPDATSLKFPVPYKRIRPEYTEVASLYGIKATVDIEVDIDAEGGIGASRIVRWAGFGIDQSVEKAVRSMNWRPAMRNGKSLPMRVLLRYNFRKVEKDEEN